MHNPLLSKNNWRFLPLTIAEQQQHIDYSEMLLSTALAGEAATLYWSLAEPTGLVLGYSQKQSVLNQRAVEQLHIPIYHRRAGGTAVLVGLHLLSLDVVLPAGHSLILPDVVESYRWFGEVWRETLAQLGIETRLVSPPEAHAQRALLKQPKTKHTQHILSRACCVGCVWFWVVVGQRKVVGLDMIRRKVGTLLQAGLLLHWDTEMLAQLLGHTQEEQDILRVGLLDRAIGIDAIVKRVISAEEIIAVFEQVLQK